MHPAVLPSATTLVVTALLAGHVALRRGSAPLRALLLALLAALMVWSGGAVLRFSAESEAQLRLAFLVMFAGIYAAPPCWLLLAARSARLAPVEEHRRLAAAAALVPALVAWLALATNPLHGLYSPRIDLGHFEYGPLFWVFAGYSYACVVGGCALFLLRARRAIVSRGWLRAGLVALAPLVPLLANALYLSGAAGLAYDVTAPAIGIAVLLLFPAIFRHELLDALPLARRDVIEHLREGVVIADAAGVVVDANPAAAALIHRPPGWLPGRRLGAVLEALAPDTSAHEWEAALGEPGAFVREIAAGDDRHVEVRSPSVRTEDGQVAGRYLVIRDRSDERRVERFLRRSQKLETVGVLAAGVAHEVNNPLAFVRSNLGWLARQAERVEARLDAFEPKEAEELAEVREILADTLGGVERIARIVEGLQRMARSPDEPSALLSANDAVRDALRTLEREDLSVASVSLRLAPDLPPVRGSRERLAEALAHLLRNALQAARERSGAAVEVETACRGGAVQIEVCDDGPGVPPGVRERIFDPFFTTRDPDQGVGLGLPIAFDAVRDHGGSLDVMPRPGGGTCCRVQLPAAGRT